MTEEKAIEFFRAIDPLDGSLRRSHPLGAHDPYDYDVVVDARPLSAPQIIDVIRTASAQGLEATVDTERGVPIFVIDSPEPSPIPAVAPKR